MLDPSPLSDLDERSREVFRRVVEGYLQSGEPIGSRTLTRSLSEKVSAATIRNVMQDLEILGLLASPHVSAGRIPTEMGLRLFVDGIMEVGDVSGQERSAIEASIGEQDDLSHVLDRAGSVLSGLTQSASLVLSPKREGSPIRHIEFVSLSAEQVLTVMVFADGTVENRLFNAPSGLTPSSMREAANFLNAILEGKSILDIRQIVATEITARRAELDRLTQGLVEAGVAQWATAADDENRLIVRGHSNLIGDAATEDDLIQVRHLFDELERKENLVQLLDLTEAGEGVRIFIGAETKLFSLSGSSLVISPYMNADRRIVGAVGVIGPKRLNYGRVVPIVDYTAQLVGKMMADRQGGPDNE